MRMASIRVRFFSFLIDLCIVYFIRSLYGFFVLKNFLAQGFSVFYTDLKEKTGLESISDVTSEHVMMFLSSDFFFKCMIFLVTLFLLSILYNFLCFYFKKASIGQLITKCHVISSDGNNANVKKLLFRSFLIMIPWMLMFVIVFDSFLSQFDINFLNSIMRAVLFLFIATWYDMILFGDRKLLGHDLISKTKIIINDSVVGETFVDKFIPNPFALLPKTKKIVKNQYESMKKFTKEAKEIIKGKKK